MSGGIDLVREHRAEYAASAAGAGLVTVGPASFLAVQGKGAPGGPAFQAAIGILYAAAYTLKFRLAAGGHFYKIAPLEALYFRPARKGGAMPWKLLLRVPEIVHGRDLQRAIAALRHKGKDASAVQLERLDEGLCAQVLHVGPYDQVAESIGAIARFAREYGLEAHGPHHEVYLSDPRLVAPARLRTLVRQPVQPMAGVHVETAPAPRHWRRVRQRGVPFTFKR